MKMVVLQWALLWRETAHCIQSIYSIYTLRMKGRTHERKYMAERVASGCRRLDAHSLNLHHYSATSATVLFQHSALTVTKIYKKRSCGTVGSSIKCVGGGTEAAEEWGCEDAQIYGSSAAMLCSNSYLALETSPQLQKVLNVKNVGSELSLEDAG